MSACLSLRVSIQELVQERYTPQWRLDGRGGWYVCVSIQELVQGVVLLTVGRSYVGNDVTYSTLLDRACACSYKNLPKYRSYRVSNTAARRGTRCSGGWTGGVAGMSACLCTGVGPGEVHASVEAGREGWLVCLRVFVQ